MVKTSRTTTTVLSWLRVFVIETLAAFGLVTVLRAAMVPPALSLIMPLPQARS